MLRHAILSVQYLVGTNLYAGARARAKDQLDLWCSEPEPERYQLQCCRGRVGSRRLVRCCFPIGPIFGGFHVQDDDVKGEEIL